MVDRAEQPPRLLRVLRLLRWLQWLSLALVVLTGVALWASERGWAPALPSSVATDAGLPGSSAEPRPEQRVAARDFELALFDGGTLRLQELRGRGVVLNFWASWCVPCREEAPLLARAWEANRDRGLTLVGVDMWDDDQDARGFLQEFGVAYPNGSQGAEQIATDYGVLGIPTTVFIDPQGRLARRWVGVLSDERLETFVQEVRP